MSLSFCFNFFLPKTLVKIMGLEFFFSFRSRARIKQFSNANGSSSKRWFWEKWKKGCSTISVAFPPTSFYDVTSSFRRNSIIKYRLWANGQKSKIDFWFEINISTYYWQKIQRKKSLLTTLISQSNILNGIKNASEFQGSLRNLYGTFILSRTL